MSLYSVEMIKGVLPLQEIHRLKKRKDFRRVFRKGQSFANRQFVIYIYPRPKEGPFRIGISVNRKIGNAVTRNRLKRRIKEITRHWAPYLKPQIDFVIIARKPSATMNYSQIQSSLRHLFNKSKIFHHIPSRNH